MLNFASMSLTLAGLLVVVASLAHLACIAIGAKAYRFMGAGERMARAVEAGKVKPTLITLVIAIVLLVWALYAFSGAGLVPPVALHRTGAVSDQRRVPRPGRRLSVAAAQLHLLGLNACPSINLQSRCSSSG